MTSNASLPPIIAGPILRHASSERLLLWLVSSQPVDLHLACLQDETCLAEKHFAAGHDHAVRVGEYAWIHLLELKLDEPLPVDTWLTYDVGVQAGSDGAIRWLRDTLPHLAYAGKRPGLLIKSRVDQLLHGSCRKPHYPGDDGLWIVDGQLAQAHKQHEPDAMPALLLMSGDQIYADDVAGPMLVAIHQVIRLLGLFDETLQGAKVADSAALYASPLTYYRRIELLPDCKVNASLRERFFGGVRKPVFTTANADNHLITLAEVLAMYLLVWSPVLWKQVELDKVSLPAEFRARYQRECGDIRHFVAGLDKVQRMLANVPVYMIFDDHDVTDDWNLMRAWEESAYGNPFSRRIIGNALIGYALCQAWGNVPGALPQGLLDGLHKLSGRDNQAAQCELIDQLLKYEAWRYTVPTTPPLVVLDTRTQRWRSERDAMRPSGLMDWESLSDLQQQLINEKAVILVSPAPIFGVKLIEVVQRVFTWFGQALTVDAENWMAHPGAANVILNIFRHKRTPHNFVILSGDVHYSFTYDVRLRHREHSPHIWQITSSGIKNTFPEALIRHFDRFNRWMFASRSPLNWLTRRRHMRIRQRRPGDYSERYRHQRLVNGCSIGRVCLDEEGAPLAIEVLLTNGECVAFTEGYESDWVD